MELFRNIKLFFTNSDYRWICKECVLMWFFTRRPVTYIIGSVLALHYKFHSRGLSTWEQYQLKVEYRLSIVKWGFRALVFSLVVSLRARGSTEDDPGEFEKNIEDLLNSELIDYPEYKSLKQWIESNSEYYTADLESLEDIYESIKSKH